jgi:hypothetical protein
MGRYEAAVRTLEHALDIVRTGYEDVDDYLLTVNHR